MNCPVCKAEMADDALRCDACKTEFEEVDTEHEPDPNLELACVESTSDMARYTVLASLLEAEGIPVALQNQVGAVMRGISDGPFSWRPPHGMVRIMVPRSHEQAARDLVAAQLPAETVEKEGAPDA